jgi:hypothetical protein
MGKVVITKVGDEPKESPKEKEVPKSIMKGSARKTQRTFPKGILKVRDPSKAPPKRKSVKQTIQLMTDKGSKKYRKTLKKRLNNLSDARIKQIVETKGLLKNKNTPVALQREMVEGGVLSGFISLD